MKKTVVAQYQHEGKTKTYEFEVIIEPERDGWVAYSPEIECWGGITWGKTRKEVEENIKPAIDSTLECMFEEGDWIFLVPVKSE